MHEMGTMSRIRRQFEDSVAIADRADHRRRKATARIGIVGKRRDKAEAAFLGGQWLGLELLHGIVPFEGRLPTVVFAAKVGWRAADYS